MHLFDPSLQVDARNELDMFAKWVLSIGDGTLLAERRASEHEATWITIPEDLLLRVEGDKVAALVSKVYPNFLLNNRDPTYLSSRAIVCPNNAEVDDVNNYVLLLLTRDTIQYLSCDIIAKS
jgi:ATP-dependent DNA helicase PIF1